MKYISFLLFCISITSEAQNRSANYEEINRNFPNECSYYYEFGTDFDFVNLENFQGLEMNGGPTNAFKQCSKYERKFRVIYDEDSIHVENRLYFIHSYSENEKYSLSIYENDKPKTTTTLPLKYPLPEVKSYWFKLFPEGDNIIVFLENHFGTHYHLWKYDVNGNLILKDSVEKTQTLIEGNVHRNENYLYFEKETPEELIFSCNGMVSGKNFTIVLSKKDFTRKILPFKMCSYVMDEAEQKIAYFIWFDSISYKLNMDGKDILSFTLEDDDSWGADETLLADSLLVIAGFHSDMPGSSLSCISLKTGKTKWIGDVIQMNFPHSKYSNQVILSRYKDKIIMEGNESGGDYLQIFDINTGKRLAEFGDVVTKK